MHLQLPALAFLLSLAAAHQPSLQARSLYARDAYAAAYADAYADAYAEAMAFGDDRALYARSAYPMAGGTGGFNPDGTLKTGPPPPPPGGSGGQGGFTASGTIWTSGTQPRTQQTVQLNKADNKYVKMSVSPAEPYNFPGPGNQLRPSPGPGAPGPAPARKRR
jgi:hypothetical protein